MRITHLLAAAAALAIISLPSTQDVTTEGWARRERQAAPDASPVPVPRHTPVRFEPNHGQFADDVCFVARGAGVRAYFQRDAIAFALVRHDGASDDAARAVVRMRMLGSDSSVTPCAGDPLPGRSHYLLGNDPDAWIRDVPHHAAVSYPGVYPDIDLVCYGNPGRLEYDFVVAPHGDPAAVRLAFEGADAIWTAPDGELVLETALGDIVQRSPVVYQERDGRREAVAAEYVLHDDEVTVALGPYDHGRRLVIDPVVEFSTYLGGTRFDVAQGVDVDGSGNIYVGGYTMSDDFPIVGGYQQTIDAPHDVFVTKLSPDGGTVLYSTYFGGDGSDTCYALAAHTDGSVHIGGSTYSEDFPRKFAIDNTDTLGNLSDAFLSCLHPSGSSLIYSGSMGAGLHDWVHDLEVDAFGNVYATGMTARWDSFPPNDTFVPGATGAVFAISLSPAGGRRWTTFFTSADVGADGYSIDVRGNTVAITGYTKGSFGPSHGFQDTFGGGPWDAFVVRMHANTGAEIWSTYLGGSGKDLGRGVAVDAQENIYVTGYTESDDFPTLNPVQPSLAASTDPFITKFSPAGTLVYSTYLGGASYDEAFGIVVDDSGAPTIGGVTYGDMDQVDAIQQTRGFQREGFLTSLNAAGNAVTFSSYVGGRDHDQVEDMALDAAGRLLVTGRTESDDFPVKNSVRGTYGASDDGFLMRIHLGGTTAVAGKAKVSRRKINFKKVKIGKTKTKKVKVRNADKKAALRITVPPGVMPFGVPEGGSSVVIPPKGKHVFEIWCTAYDKGKYTTTLTLSTSDPRHPTFDLKVSGKGK